MQFYSVLTQFLLCSKRWPRCLMWGNFDNLKKTTLMPQLSVMQKEMFPFSAFTGRGSFWTIDRIAPPYPSRESITFLSCFLLYNLSGVSQFLLLFTYLWSEIFKIWPFSLHSRVLFFLFFALYSVCMCVGGRSRLVSATPPPPHTHTRKQRKGKKTAL